MACIAYIYGDREGSSQQIKELLYYADHFGIHISPWVFDKDAKRQHLHDFLLNPETPDTKVFLTLSLLNLAETMEEAFVLVAKLIFCGFHVICLTENVDTHSLEELHALQKER